MKSKRRLYIGIKSLSLSKGLFYRCLSDKLCKDIRKVYEVELSPGGKGKRRSSGKVCLEFQVVNKVIPLETLHFLKTKAPSRLCSSEYYVVFIQDERSAKKLKRREQINQKSFP